MIIIIINLDTDSDTCKDWDVEGEESGICKPTWDFFFQFGWSLRPYCEAQYWKMSEALLKLNRANVKGNENIFFADLELLRNNAVEKIKYFANVCRDPKEALKSDYMSNLSWEVKSAIKAARIIEYVCPIDQLTERADEIYEIWNEWNVACIGEPRCNADNLYGRLVARDLLINPFEIKFKVKGRIAEVRFPHPDWMKYFDIFQECKKPGNYCTPTNGFERHIRLISKPLQQVGPLKLRLDWTSKDEFVFRFNLDLIAVSISPFFRKGKALFKNTPLLMHGHEGFAIRMLDTKLFSSYICQFNTLIDIQNCARESASAFESIVQYHINYLSDLIKSSNTDVEKTSLKNIISFLLNQVKKTNNMPLFCLEAVSLELNEVPT